MYRNYEPLENTDGLEIQDLLQRIRIAHTKYGPDSRTSDEDTDTISDLSELLYQARTKDASFSDVKSQSPKGGTEAEQDMPTLDIIRSRTPNHPDHDGTQTVDDTSQKPDTTESPDGISPLLLGQSAGEIFNLSASETSQSSHPSNDAAATDSATGVTNATACIAVPDILGVPSQTASDKTKSQDLLSGRKTSVARPTIPQSQTSVKEKETQKREAELWKFVCDYWKEKGKKLRR